MSDKKRKKNNVITALVFFALYLAGFELLEKLESPPAHIIRSSLDDYIPFCEYFIVFYFSWFLFLTVTLVYYAVANGKGWHFHKVLLSIMMGMVLFLFVSLVYPNGHDLRPQVTGTNGFAAAVRYLHSIDTPTNILPSMHVYCAVACMIAWWKDTELNAKRRWIKPLTGFVGIMIVLSTMFLKQHTVIDVFTALILNILVYLFVYRFLPKNYKKFNDILNFRDMLAIPNLLSLFRIVLAVVFLGVLIRYSGDNKIVIMISVLAVAAVTDFLDGRIARRFNMVTEIGKILDPLADKITQGALMFYLTTLRREAVYLFVLFIIKEVIVSLIGSRIVLITKKNEGAKWYGKINTFVFYVIMLAFVLWPDMSNVCADCLMVVCTIFMIMALFMYIKLYISVVRSSHKEGV